MRIGYILRDWSLTASLLYIGLCVCVAVLASVLAPDGSPHANAQVLAHAKLPPLSTADSHSYLLGTDALGRDTLSRLLLGTRVSVAVGLLAMTLSVLFGTLIGLVAGYVGGRTDAALMWLVSVVWSLPTMLLALSLSFLLGQGFWQVILAIGLSSWVEVARIVRGQVLSVRTHGYVEAARALGFGTIRILRRHILPNIAAPLTVVAVANFGSAVLTESGLSFLGLGLEGKIPTWGRMISDGYTQIVFAHGRWLALFPGAALMLLVIAINVIGLRLRKE
jgi:ABC-type dipeptide/oligopeptide/nickel transport system permease subunit